jgi:glycosyltransferase involved in cell wall biosynthesis
MSAPDEINVAAARSVYDGRIDRLTMGCDFDFWVPPPDTGSRKAARDALAVPRARKLFLTVGRLSPSKRVDALLRAFRALGDRRDFTLLIVGQGDPRYVRYLRDIAGTMLTDGRVVFHAHATGIQLRRLYWAADVFVSGSRSEGGPVTIMEAMACGLPIIATPVGRTFEAMGGFGPGNTLAVRDPNSWPDVLRAALDQAGLRPVDREMARNHFDWRIIGQRLVAILSNITERRGTNAGSVGQPLSLDTTDPCPL